MVVELSSLAGYMAREYALKAGETPEVAAALYEMEQPRTAGGALPESRPGALLALADRFDLLMAMFALGAKPTGSSDPFALRRAALGVIGILRSQPTLSAISVEQGLHAAADQLRQQGLEVSAESIADALEFVTGRFGQQLREEGVPSTLAAAVQPLAGSPGKAEAVLRDIGEGPWPRWFPEARGGHPTHHPHRPGREPSGIRHSLLREDAERALHEKVVGRCPTSPAARCPSGRTPRRGRCRHWSGSSTRCSSWRRSRSCGRLASGCCRPSSSGPPQGIDWRALHSALAD